MTTRNDWADEDDTPAHRVVTAAGGARRWRVWEMDTSRQPWARGAGCLVFDGGDIVRRVWGVPDGWQEMTDRELLALLDESPLLP